MGISPQQPADSGNGRSRQRSWISRAACSSADPEIFFSPDTSLRNRAKWVCAECEVRQQCLRHALTQPERHGIWGGLDEAERRIVARRLRSKRDTAGIATAKTKTM